MVRGISRGSALGGPHIPKTGSGFIFRETRSMYGKVLHEEGDSADTLERLEKKGR